jgi:hypothetical protein
MLYIEYTARSESNKKKPHIHIFEHNALIERPRTAGTIF